MSVLVNKETRLLVQGYTGAQGTFHATNSINYGTTVVGGVTPGKGGTKHLDRPVFDTVGAAVRETGANATVIFVPPPFAADAIMEAADAGIALIVCITEGIPVRDMIAAKQFLTTRGSRLIGPNCPGIVTPGEGKDSHGGCRIGISPGYIHKKGNIGVVSRSGPLTYEAVWQLTCRGVGQSTCVGIGGDPVHGLSHVDVSRMLNDDPETEGIVLIGEIGGSDEEIAAAYIKEHVKKPVVGFIAGASAPKGKRMGHAGAIVDGNAGTAQSKKDALRAAGVTVAETAAEIGRKMAEAMKR